MEEERHEFGPHQDGGPLANESLVRELYQQLRQHQAAQQISFDLEEKFRIYQDIQQLRARICEAENE